DSSIRLSDEAIDRVTCARVECRVRSGVRIEPSDKARIRLCTHGAERAGDENPAVGLQSDGIDELIRSRMKRIERGLVDRQRNDATRGTAKDIGYHDLIGSDVGRRD